MPYVRTVKTKSGATAVQVVVVAARVRVRDDQYPGPRCSVDEIRT